MAAAYPKPSCPEADCLQEAGLQARVLFPENAEFIARQESYWSNSAKIEPSCIIQPTTAEEVSTAVKALVAAGQKFAVRSGGHTQYAGANNIKGGITIDLGLMNATTFNKDSETVDLGPGGRWGEVYTKLREYKRVVAGGREGNVGVAGLILGGGNTYLTARRGFACDNVVSYEVVLADGRIVTADQDNHTDLFRALKGGSSNFGIVTNFRTKAIECDEVWGGITLYPLDVASEAISMLTEFTDNVQDDVDSNLLLFFTYMPEFKDNVILIQRVQVAGIADAPAYNPWSRLKHIEDTCKMTSIADIAKDYGLPPKYYNIWFTACFKNDPRILAKGAELHAAVVKKLKVMVPDGDFITQCLFQPLPTLFGQRATESGRANIMGLDSQPHNGILLLAAAMLKTCAQHAAAYGLVSAWVADLKAYAATIPGGNLPWTYLNYADPSQDPLGSYGAANVQFMKDVAAKYDPDAVFQRLCPGGFKISQVGATEEKTVAFSDVVAEIPPTKKIPLDCAGLIPDWPVGCELETAVP